MQLFPFLRRSLLLFVACLAATWAHAAAAVDNPRPFVVPELTSWQGARGEFHPTGRIVVSDRAFLPVAERFASDYAELFSRRLSVVQGKGRAGDIVLARADRRDTLGTEGYRLTVGETATIAATTVQGAFWGTRTILQISEQTRSHALPCGVATDRPAYPVRGFMIDVGRKYIPMDYLRQLVKVMAYYKMNTLQVHLNDNGFKQYFGNDWAKTPAAFRLESDFFPGLTARDGSYTKKEFRAFQREAAAQGVEILPEIDVPAHSLAFTHYRPSLGSEEFGADHLNLRNPAVVPFLDSLFTEYCAGPDPVFVGPRVHIGTDEYSNKDKAVVELFRSLTDHLIRHVERYGKQAVAWGALTHADGQTPVKSKNVILEAWYNGYADPAKMKAQGYQLISIPDGYVYIVPAAGYYYDYLNCPMLYEKWTPAQIGNQKFEEGDPAILGGMFAVWNDHAGNGITVRDIHHRVMPALRTISAKTWTGAAVSVPYAEFARRGAALSEAPGVNLLGRLPGIAEGRATLRCPRPVLQPNAPVDWVGDAVGYDYTVSFDLEADSVRRGDVLFSSSDATVYLASPKNGKLAFEREGYLNEFDYVVPAGRKVRLTFVGTNRETLLFVDGRFRQALYPLTLGSASTDAGLAGASADPYAASKMYYQRTLVFPLARTGNFVGRISDLSVSNYAEKY